MVKDNPEAAKLRKRREKDRLAAQGLKRTSGITVPIGREAELKAIACRMVEEHLAAAGVADDQDEETSEHDSE